MTKYQVRVKSLMSDSPASDLFDTYAEAQERLKEVRKEIRETWASPDEDCAYIFINRYAERAFKPRKAGN